MNDHPRLESIFASILGVPESALSEATGPKVLAAWNSLRHVEIVTRIEDAYGVTFSTPELLSLQTIGSFRAMLLRKGVTA